MTLLGLKISVPFGPPTWTTCVATVPSDGAIGSVEASVDVCMLAIADEVVAMSMDSDAAGIICVAAEKLTRAEAMIDLEKSILSCVCLGYSFEMGRCKLIVGC